MLGQRERDSFLSPRGAQPENGHDSFGFLFFPKYRGYSWSHSQGILCFKKIIISQKTCSLQRGLDKNELYPSRLLAKDSTRSWACNEQPGVFLFCSNEEHMGRLTSLYFICLCHLKVKVSPPYLQHSPLTSSRLYIFLK